MSKIEYEYNASQVRTFPEGAHTIVKKSDNKAARKAVRTLRESLRNFVASVRGSK